MSKPLLLAAAVLLGSAGIAAAQPAPGGPPAAPPGGPDASAMPDMSRPRPPGPPGEGRPFMMREMMRRGMMRGPHGAHFTFERGDAVIDLRCADNETTRACVDAAAVLLDKLGPVTPPR